MELHDNWYEEVEYDWRMKLAELGFEGAEIHIEGFYCQGNGACFFTDDINFETVYRNIVKRPDFNQSFNRISELEESGEESLYSNMGIETTDPIMEFIKGDNYNVSIKKYSYRHSHENSISIETSYDYYTTNGEDNPIDHKEGWITYEDESYLESFDEYIEGYITTYVKELCREIYSDLEKDYESQMEELEKETA